VGRGTPLPTPLNSTRTEVHPDVLWIVNTKLSIFALKHQFHAMT